MHAQPSPFIEDVTKNAACVGLVVISKCQLMEGKGVHEG